MKLKLCLPWNTQTAGIDVVLKVREISRMGIALLLMVLILLAVVRTTSRIADAKNNLAKQLIGKTDAWYIATGEVSVHRYFSPSFVVDGYTLSCFGSSNPAIIMYVNFPPLLSSSSLD